MMKTGLLAVAALALLPAAANAQAFSENFDSQGTPGTSDLNYNGFTDFTVTGQVDLVQTGQFNITCAGGSGKCVDLDGTSGPGSIVSPSIAYTAGQTFTISFDASGNQRDAGQDDNLTFFIDFGQLLGFDGTCNAQAGCNSGTGFLQSTAEFDYILNGADPFATYTYTITPFSSGFLTISLGTDSADNIGPIVDNVSVTGAVPEPATWGLMILGFGAVGATLRRRSTKVAYAA